MVQKPTQIPRTVFEYSFKNASLNLQIADCIASESCPPSPLKRLEPFFFLFSPWISHLLDLLRTPCFLFLFSRFPSQVGIHWFFFLEGWVLDFSTNSLLNFSQNSSLNSFLSLLILFNSSPKCHYFSLGLIPHSKNHNPLLKSFQNLSPSRSYFPKKILLIAVLTS